MTARDVDASVSVPRICAAGRLGDCFHQNAALEWLLTELGFSVSRRHGHVWFRPEDELGTALNPLVLVVSGVPTDDNQGGHWWADAGLGAGYGAQAAGRPTGPAAWTYRHLAGGALRGVVVISRDHSAAAIDDSHRRLRSGEDSPFRRTTVPQRIDGPAQRTVRGLVHQVMTPDHCEEQDLTSYDEWRAALVDDLLLPVADVTDDEWASLRERTRDAHRAWDEAGRP